MVTPSCFSILGIDLFSASMRAWRCSAMRMVLADPPEMAPPPQMTTAPQMATDKMAKLRPARSAVDLIAFPAGAAFQPPAYSDNLDCTRLHKLGNRMSGRGVPAAESPYDTGIAGYFFRRHPVDVCAN